MALYRNNGELLTERRGIIDAVVNSLGKSDHGSRILRRGRRLGRITKHKLSRWLLLLTALISVYFTVCGLKIFIHDGSITAKMESRFPATHSIREGLNLHSKHEELNLHSIHKELNLQETVSLSEFGKPPPKSKRRKHFPCEVEFLKSVDGLAEPKNYMNFTWFSLDYVKQEGKTSDSGFFEP